MSNRRIRSIHCFRVYGCNFPTVPNDILIKAIEMAYKAGMDIINLSLGLHGGWQEEILAEVANRVVKKGVHSKMNYSAPFNILIFLFSFSNCCKW